MLIGLTIYLAGQKYLPKEHFEPQHKGHVEPARMQPGDWPALIALLLLIPVMAISIVPNNQIFNAYLVWRSEEHTSELQSLMRISYAVFCLKKKKNHIHK